MTCLRRIFFSTLLAATTIFSTAQQKIKFEDAPPSPQVFAETFISTSLNERDFALSPDGTELYFTITLPQSAFQTIVVSKQEKKGKWSKPEVVSFAGNFSDLEPALSADGKKLYFASNRPVMGNLPKDFDIWVVERVGKKWGEPKNLGASINTKSDEFYPSIAKSGNLYFTAQYNDGVGHEDIYMAAWKNNAYENPVPMDSAINSKGYEFNAFVDPDEQFILFTGYGRKDDSGRGDLYMSVKNSNGEWQPAKNLKLLNSTSLDYCPSVSPDKKILFFTSERSVLPTSFERPTSYTTIKELNNSVLNSKGNIYWVLFENVMNVVQSD
ncbi:MAG: PD40 domain-containing protein [Cyclobacteriaceae bacterium]|nr:PD40 domain-containing protein [Cyclobacteriaceae bacterium]